MGNIKALALTTEDWNIEYNIPDFVELVCNEQVDAMSKTLYDLVFIDRKPSAKELEVLLRKSTKAYTVFVTDNVIIDKKLRHFMDCRKADILKEENIQLFFDEKSRNFFSAPYGEKKYLQHMAISKFFGGNIEWTGGCFVTLTGSFGTDLKQIAYWKYNIVISKDQCLDMFLEYEKKGNVDIQLNLTKFKEGTRFYEEDKWTFHEEQLKDTIRVDNKNANGFIFASISARGEGELKIIGLHVRNSRRGEGEFLPGGRVHRTSKGEELFSYFDPGDMKPPLNVYFSGYKTQEGFEGYYMMKNLGCPFLLIGEPRLEGGAFYIGEDEYEYLVKSTIQMYMDELGFDSSDVILSGLSMGTTGALYYSADIQPNSVIIGKPLLSLGNVAENERRFRPGGFPTSVDVLLKTIGSTEDEAIEALNNKIWNKVGKADYTNTDFIVSYMIEDDYDMGAYNRLIEGLSATGVHIYGKGLHGRHNDDTNGIVYWFISRYKNVLREEFKREV